MNDPNPVAAQSILQNRLRSISKLKPWQILLSLLFVLLLLPSLVTPPSILIAWTILCSVLVYRWWLTRIVARWMLQSEENPQLLKGRVYWSSIWSLSWRSFLLCVFLPSFLLYFIAPTPEQAGAGAGVTLVTWILSIILSLDVPLWIGRGFNPSAVTAGFTGAIGLLASATPIGVFLAVPAVLAGVAARKQLRSSDASERGRRLALVGLVLGAIVLLLYLGMMVFLALSGRLSTPDFTKPLPPTRTEEMQQRAEAFAERTGDSGMSEVIDENLEAVRRLEEHSGEMIAAYEKLNPEAIFDPASASSQTIDEQVKAVTNLQAVALQYKDTAIQFRQKVATDMAKKYSDKPDEVRKGLDNSQAGMQLAVQWSDAAVAFSDAARRLLQSYQDTSSVDASLLQAAAVRGEEYDDAQAKVIERMVRNFENAERQMPR